MHPNGNVNVSALDGGTFADVMFPGKWRESTRRNATAFFEKLASNESRQMTVTEVSVYANTKLIGYSRRNFYMTILKKMTLFGFLVKLDVDREPARSKWDYPTEKAYRAIYFPYSLLDQPSCGLHANI